MLSEGLAWGDGESTGHCEDDWDTLSQFSVASCPVAVEAPPAQVGRRKLELQGDMRGIQTALNGNGMVWWHMKMKVAITIIATALMMVATVRIRTEDSRMTLATTSSFQHKSVVTSEILSKAYETAGFASTAKLLDDIGISTSLTNLADASYVPVNSTDVPFFFHIPRSGGGTVKDILGRCYGFTQASDLGGHKQGSLRSASLEVMHADDGSAYVNVDTSTAEGIQKAKSVGLVESGLANVIASPHFHPAATLFNADQEGRCFTMMRHPIERAVSMFHYLAVAKWEPTYDPSLAYISIEMYARSKRLEHNWMVRFLSNELESDLTDDHLRLAKEVLSKKCVVGLLTRKEESFQRFEQYFGWAPKNKEQSDCRDRLMQWGWSNKHSHPEVEEGSVAWDLLYMKNSFDMKLYHYAMVLFNEQARLFEAQIKRGDVSEGTLVTVPVGDKQ